VHGRQAVHWTGEGKRLGMRGLVGAHTLRVCGHITPHTIVATRLDGRAPVRPMYMKLFDNLYYTATPTTVPLLGGWTSYFPSPRSYMEPGGGGGQVSSCQLVAVAAFAKLRRQRAASPQPPRDRNHEDSLYTRCTPSCPRGDHLCLLRLLGERLRCPRRQRDGRRGG